MNIAKSVIAVILIAIIVGGCATAPQVTSSHTNAKMPSNTPETQGITTVLSQDLVMFSDLAECSKASAYLPMAPRGNIKNPSVLADRIEVSLRDDPAGNSRIRGTNATPEQYLQAVQAAGGTVSGIGALPEYLRSLVSSKMPEGTIRMSRMSYTKKSEEGQCAERFQLDVTEGYARSAMDGEQGWYDVNTGRLILAANCTNSPIHPRKEQSVMSAPSTDYREVPLTCVPIEEEHEWNVVFPNANDFEAWRRCNPTARCSLECERWLAQGDRFAGGKGDYYSSRVRKVTGQQRSDTYALKGVTHRPTYMTGSTVMCEQGTNNYWAWLPGGEIQFIENWDTYLPMD